MIDTHRFSGNCRERIPIRSRDELLGRFLLAVLRRGPATWTHLARLGLDRHAVLHGVGAIAEAGHDRVRIGPLLLELEEIDE